MKVINNNNDAIVPLLFKSLNSFKNDKSDMCLDDVEKIFKNLLASFIYKDDEPNINYLKNEFLALVQRGSFPKTNITAFRFIKYYNSKELKTDIASLVDFLIA